MILISKPGTFISRSLAMIFATLIIAFSCTKSKNNTTVSSTVKYCTTINWSNTDGQSGTFTGAAIDGTYALVYSEYKENGNVGGFPLHYDANNHLISDQPGVVYTYTSANAQGYLSQISVDLQNGNGNGTYNFDSNGHLTSGTMNFTSPGFSGTITGTYTYDSNEDPVTFSASGTINTPQGPEDYNLQITGDFLLDKTSLLPFMPVFAPASSYFSFIPFTSKHLLNKWDVSMKLNGVSYINYTIQYTYTYDSNGNIATMVNTGNSNNIYTFTYADCPK
jgi:hypothetical protein